MAGELTKHNCPKCGAKLLFDKEYGIYYCSFVGGRSERGCNYEFKPIELYNLYKAAKIHIVGGFSEKYAQQLEQENVRLKKQIEIIGGQNVDMAILLDKLKSLWKQRRACNFCGSQINIKKLPCLMEKYWNKLEE